MPLDLRPLTNQDADVQRGMTVTLEPDREDSTRIIEFNSICVRGELLGVVLGIREEGRPCCHPPDCTHGSGLFALPIVRAELEWGLGGATFFAEADFLNGTVLSVVAESLKVCAKYIVWGDPCAPWLPTFRASAGVGYIARSANSNPARFTELVTVGAGQKASIAIPNFALSFTVQPLDPAPALVQVAVLGPCGPRIPYVVVSPLTNLGQHNVENALPLFNGATQIEVDNTTGIAPLAVFIIFGLAL